MNAALRFPARVLAALCILPALARAQPAGSPPASPADFPLTAYSAVGSGFARNSRLAELGWTEAQFNAFLEGVRATFKGQPFPVNAQAEALQEEIGRQMQRLEEKENQARKQFFSDPTRVEKFMRDITKGMSLQRSDSGMAYALLSQGVGSRPGPEDTVVVSYTVTAADGRTDLPTISMEKRRIKVTELMPGVAEAVQMLVVGGSGMFVLPPDLTYGNGKWPEGVDPGAPLIFVVNVYEIAAQP